MTFSAITVLTFSAIEDSEGVLSGFFVFALDAGKPERLQMSLQGEALSRVQFVTAVSAL